MISACFMGIVHDEPRNLLKIHQIQFLKNFTRKWFVHIQRYQTLYNCKIYQYYWCAEDVLHSVMIIRSYRRQLFMNVYIYMSETFCNCLGSFAWLVVVLISIMLKEQVHGSSGWWPSSLSLSAELGYAL